MSPRAHGHSVRKVCSHGWRGWPKCTCAWYFSFKPRGSSQRYRFSLDAELGFHFDSKTEAETAATAIRNAILAGTFERAADRLAREQREAEARAAVEATARAAAAANSAVVTFDGFVKVYVERGAQASGKTSWKDDR